MIPLNPPDTISGIRLQFDDDDLPVGTILVTSEGDRHLVGIINQVGGVCECCGSKSIYTHYILPDPKLIEALGEIKGKDPRFM